MKYAFIHSERKNHHVSRLCSALNVSASGYYNWIERPPNETQKANRRLVTKIRCYQKASHRIYGSPRIHSDLVANGESVSQQRVARLMRAEQIQSKIVKRFVITTNSRHTTAPAPDRLQRRFKTALKNEA